MPKTKEQLEQSRIRRADKLKRINEHRILMGNDPYRSYAAYLKNRPKPPRTQAQKDATAKMIAKRNEKMENGPLKHRTSARLTKKDLKENKINAKRIVNLALKQKLTPSQKAFIETEENARILNKTIKQLPMIPIHKPLPQIPVKLKKVSAPVIVPIVKQVMDDAHKKAIEAIIKKDKKNWSPRTKPNIERDIVIRANKKIEIIKVKPIIPKKTVNRQKKQAEVKKAKAEAQKIKKQERIKVIKAKIDAEKEVKKVVDKKVKVAKKKVKVAENKVNVAQKKAKVVPTTPIKNGMSFVDFMMRKK